MFYSSTEVYRVQPEERDVCGRGLYLAETCLLGQAAGAQKSFPQSNNSHGITDSYRLEKKCQDVSYYLKIACEFESTWFFFSHHGLRKVFVIQNINTSQYFMIS